ncbi:MAG: hypothetical protein RBT01_11600 [Anaerolineaceae bacterium]|jgi:hypothetical protein|nr:hypothetical protein [Anaerolineaceae bacterium]
MTEPRQDYVPPAIIFEADIETNAGPSPVPPIILDPLEAELRGWDWPVESDYITPKE